MRDLRVRSVALDYARSNKFDLFTALMSRFSESSVLTYESELQRGLQPVFTGRSGLTLPKTTP